jgi:hypothetical protein
MEWHRPARELHGDIKNLKNCGRPSGKVTPIESFAHGAAGAAA